MRETSNAGREPAWQSYKKLRNKCLASVRRDSRLSAVRLQNETGKADIWRVVNKLKSDGQRQQEIKLRHGDRETTERAEVAELLNEFSLRR